MSQVSMQQVKELRDRTQAGLNDCRSALVEAAGDMEKAVEIILKKGLAKSAKRAGALATEGEVAALVAGDGRSGVIVEVNIQTDFAARNPDFKAFVQKVLEVASRAKPSVDLGAESYPGSSETVEATRQALVGKLGENIVIRRWDRVQLEGSGKVHSYVHTGGQIGVLIAIEVANAAAANKPEVQTLAEGVAMQVCAMSPTWTAKSDIPENAKNNQREIYEAQLVEEGKPEAARPKIIDGKLGKWMKEVCLLEQPFVQETNKTVDQVRAETAKALGTEVVIRRFVRFQVGEGIEKQKSDDFAAEVAKMAGN